MNDVGAALPSAVPPPSAAAPSTVAVRVAPSDVGTQVTKQPMIGDAPAAADAETPHTDAPALGSASPEPQVAALAARPERGFQGGSSWRLKLGALGGVTAATTPTAVAAASFILESGAGRLQLELEGGFEAARTIERAEGSAWAAQRWLTLSGGARFSPIESVALSAAIGIRGWQIAAGAGGFTQTRAASVLGFGGALSLGAAYRLGPVWLMARAVGGLRLPQERLTIEGFGEVLLLKPWQLGVFAGLGWHFR